MILGDPLRREDAMTTTARRGAVACLASVLLTQYGGIKLFLSQGGGRFQDVTEEAGLSNPLWGTSAAFLDYNRDGWLDLVVVNYLYYDPKKDCLTAQGTKEFCGPMSFPGTCSK